MAGSGEEERETIRPEFNPAVMIDFQGAKITSDTGFLLLREMDQRFGILDPMESELEDARSWVHSKHSQLQMARQRGYQIAAGYDHGRRWQVHVASAFPLARYYQAVFG